MSVKVKICGMRDSDNILEVAALNPDFIGFIFHSQSPRFVSNDFKVPAAFPAPIKKVGVFVNEPVDRIIATTKLHNLDFVQLHGDESVDSCRELHEARVGVIKAFSINKAFNFQTIDHYKKEVDFFLFDAKGKYYGGNDTAFDWNILNRYDQEVPFFLSGGISKNNIQEISRLSEMNLYAVDVNSGVEVRPAVKDITKVKDLLKNIA